nr:RPM1-interacting protein 4 [Tanacetum cinerariifolium]
MARGDNKYNVQGNMSCHVKDNLGKVYAGKEEKGRPLPKFGDWDVNDPASAEGFTVIFNKARDEKKTGGNPESPSNVNSGARNAAAPNIYILYLEYGVLSFHGYGVLYFIALLSLVSAGTNTPRSGFAACKHPMQNPDMVAISTNRLSGTSPAQPHQHFTFMSKKVPNRFNDMIHDLNVNCGSYRKNDSVGLDHGGNGGIADVVDGKNGGFSGVDGSHPSDSTNEKDDNRCGSPKSYVSPVTGNPDTPIIDHVFDSSVKDVDNSVKKAELNGSSFVKALNKNLPKTNKDLFEFLTVVNEKGDEVIIFDDELVRERMWGKHGLTDIVIDAVTDAARSNQGCRNDQPQRQRIQPQGKDSDVEDEFEDGWNGGRRFGQRGTREFDYRQRAKDVSTFHGDAYNLAIRAENQLTKSSILIKSVPSVDPSSQHTTKISSIDTEMQVVSTNTTTTKTTNPYARPVMGKCFKCDVPGHRSNDCRDNGGKVNLTLMDDEFGNGGETNTSDEDVDAEIFGDIKVTERCKIPFLIGKYKDEIMFDIADMDACHILLGRPWAYDVNATHKGKENTYTFHHDGVKMVLVPLSDGYNTNVSSSAEWENDAVANAAGSNQ